MTTFISMVDKIASDLRRSNLTDDIKAAINDAIVEASKTRFWFNEVEMADTLMSGQEYTFTNPFPIIEVDYVHVLNGAGQWDGIEIVNAYDNFRDLTGAAGPGYPQYYTLYEGRLRIWPKADQLYNLQVGGYSKQLVPLVADGATNSWITEGELYIRALAKRNVVRDVIRDYGEAGALDAIAKDYEQQLIEETAMRVGTNTVRSTQF